VPDLGPARYAVSYTPPPPIPLTRFGIAWLGRDHLPPLVAPLTNGPLTIDRLALLCQPDRASPFVVLHTAPLTGPC
jgi:hypothetical protein